MKAIASKPLLFNDEMARAVHAGDKVVTRGLVNLSVDDGFTVNLNGSELVITGEDNRYSGISLKARYQVGDEWWSRETFATASQFDSNSMTAIADLAIDAGYWQPPYASIWYRADQSNKSARIFGPTQSQKGKWRPNIFMPRWASRAAGIITDVRIERLQDITEEDCIAEGCQGGHDSIRDYMYSATPREHFRHVWNSSYPLVSWESNPWVYVLTLGHGGEQP